MPMLMWPRSKTSLALVHLKSTWTVGAVVGAGLLHHCPQDELDVCEQPPRCALPSVTLPDFALSSNLMVFSG